VSNNADSNIGKLYGEEILFFKSEVISGSSLMQCICFTVCVVFFSLLMSSVVGTNAKTDPLRLLVNWDVKLFI